MLQAHPGVGACRCSVPNHQWPVTGAASHLQVWDLSYQSHQANLRVNWNMWLKTFPFASVAGEPLHLWLKADCTNFLISGVRAVAHPQVLTCPARHPDPGVISPFPLPWEEVQTKDPLFRLMKLTELHIGWIRNQFARYFYEILQWECYQLMLYQRPGSWLPFSTAWGTSNAWQKGKFYPFKNTINEQEASGCQVRTQQCCLHSEPCLE